MPKVRSNAPRKVKKPKEVGSTTTSDTDESEIASSQGSQSSEMMETESIASGDGEAEAVTDEKENVAGEGEIENLSDSNNDEGWKELPSLIDNVKLKKGGKFPYITKDPRYKEFELNERKELLRIKDGIDMMRDNFTSALQITRSLCPDSKTKKVGELMPILGFPKTYKDLVLKLVSLDEDDSSKPATADTGTEPQDDVEMNEEEIQKLMTPHASKTKVITLKNKFPSPAKMAKMATPKNTKVFHFAGHSTHKGGLSTNKAPRLPKPGEVVYSQGGSPILQRRVPEPSFPRERVEVVEADGTKIEVDVVYRGANDPSKLRVFQELAKDFRGIAATRSTVKQNRVQAPRIKGFTQSATKSKPKPEWR